MSPRSPTRILISGLLMLGTPLFSQTSACSPAVSHITLTSGTFSSQPGVSFTLRHFVAALVPIGKTAPSCFEKMTVVSRAEIFVSNQSLTSVFQQKLGASENNKIKDLKIENGLGKVTLTGKITKLIPIDFTIEGPVTTDGTLLLLDARKIKADGIPIKALLSLLGEHLSGVLGLKDVKGVSVDGNSLTFSPEAVAHLKGHIQSVETNNQGLILRYGKAARAK